PAPPSGRRLAASTPAPTSGIRGASAPTAPATAATIYCATDRRRAGMARAAPQGSDQEGGHQRCDRELDSAHGRLQLTDWHETMPSSVDTKIGILASTRRARVVEHAGIEPATCAMPSPP